MALSESPNDPILTVFRGLKGCFGELLQKHSLRKRIFFVKICKLKGVAYCIFM